MDGTDLVLRRNVPNQTHDDWVGGIAKILEIEVLGGAFPQFFRNLHFLMTGDETDDGRTDCTHRV